MEAAPAGRESGARDPAAPALAARVPAARVPAARGPAARVPAARGPAARGPGAPASAGDPDVSALTGPASAAGRGAGGILAVPAAC